MTHLVILEQLRKALPSTLTAGQIHSRMTEEEFNRTTRSEVLAALEQLVRLGLAERYGTGENITEWRAL